MRTAEELKEAVKEYADHFHPDWDVASITVSRGPGEKPESLVIARGTGIIRELSYPSLPAESLN